MSIKLSLAVTHVPWVPERVAFMARLRAALGLTEAVKHWVDGAPEGTEPVGTIIAKGEPLPAPVIAYREERDKGTNDVWSGKIWGWSIEQTWADWCAFGQEDVIPMPGFWPAVVAMLEALPDDADVVGLQAAHPLIRQLALEGHRWCTSADMLIGPFYFVRRAALEEFLIWRNTKLKAGWRKPTAQKLPQLTEDTMLGVWALATGRKIWHPIPTLIDHDTSIASTGGNDHHQHRRPVVTWESNAWKVDEDFAIDDVRFWMRAKESTSDNDGTNAWSANSRAGIPHLGRFYEATPSLAYQWVEGFTEAEYVKARANDGRVLKRRLAAMLGGLTRPASSPKAKVLVLSPLRDGRTHSGYNATLCRYLRAEGVTLIELEDSWQWQEDLLRVRARMWRMLLETEATHAHHLDGDVEAHPIALLSMIATNRPIVLTPYPRRGKIDFEKVAKEHAGPPEARAYTYGIRVLPGPTSRIGDDQCVDIAGGPLGCSVVKRETIAAMIEHYGKPLTPPAIWENVAATWEKGGKRVDGVEVEARAEPLADLLRRAYELGQQEPDLNFDDLEGGTLKHPTVGVFNMITENRDLLSEDHTICLRARRMGIPVGMYLGQGSPATHHGDHAYRGFIEAFGLTRERIA